MNGRHNSNVNRSGNAQIVGKKCSLSGREFVVLNVNDTSNTENQQNDDLLKEPENEIQAGYSEKDYAEFNFEVALDSDVNYEVGTALADGLSDVKGSGSSKLSINNVAKDDTIKIIPESSKISENKKHKNF